MSGILVIGSSNMDLIMKMERLPQSGETLTDCSFSQAFGGKGANQAVAAARSGGEVTFVTCLGNDTYADMMIRNFKKDNIRTDYIFRSADQSTGTALIMVGSKGENYITVAPGANYQLTPKMINSLAEEIKNAAMVVLQYEILPETLDHIVSLCNDYRIPVLFNMAPARKVSEQVLKNLKYLVVNETEAQFLTGTQSVRLSNVEEAGFDILELGPLHVIITLGESGSYLASENNSFHVPSYHVKAIDTTAAGDVYCGSLATALAGGQDLPDAVTYATAASALAVTRLGAQPSAPFKKDILLFMKENKLNN